MSRHQILELALLAAVALMAGLCYYISRPTCYVCTWCGELYKEDGTKVRDAETLRVGHGLCHACRPPESPVHRPRTAFWFIGVLVILAAPFAALFLL